MGRTSSIVPRPPAEFLRALYVHLELGCPEIGRLFERDAKTVLWWLREAEIPTRPLAPTSAAPPPPPGRPNQMPTQINGTNYTQSFRPAGFHGASGWGGNGDAR